MLLKMIWLQDYPMIWRLASMFKTPKSSVHQILVKMIPLLHVYLVPKYIRWPSIDEWRRLAGSILHWPNVVAILDGTPFWISKPKGNIQRIFYRRDRHCFFLNWLVIVDINGRIVLSKPGYVGHLHDSSCFRFDLKICRPKFLQLLILRN